ncbi:MAG TPA: serine/threonine-protein kinase [Gemmatimonadaceae bacterium]
MSSLKICPHCGTEYELDQRFCPKDGTTLRLQNETGDLVGSIVADRYHVLRKLGEGGMGQVYLAEHVKMGRKSALKVMNPAMVKDADAISRFNREAANASHINHPNVADVYDFGETPDGIIYLAMEFVDGPPLTKLIEEQGPLSPQRAATIVRQTADALAAAHDMGIVHRDLKPDNIMIARNRDGSDMVKVVDFGIAKAADNVAQKVTKTGLVVGTPEYMSPEQLAGDKLDGRSDIYALGLVAFNMLTGRLPFPADTVQESMIMRLTESPRKLAEMRPDVAWSGEVQASLDKALERDSSARYQTASEFGRAFSRALERMAVPSGTAVRSSSARADVASPSRGSLPITRVGNERPSSGQGDASKLAADQPTLGIPIRRRGRTMAVGAGGVILVAAIIVTAMAYRQKPSEPPVTGDTVTHANVPASDLGSHADSSKFAAPMGAPALTTGGHAAQNAATTRPVDVAAALDSLEKIVSGDVTPNEAVRVIGTLEEMKSRIRGNEQIVHAGYVEALARSSAHDSAGACAVLRRVQAIAPGTSRAKIISRAIGLSSC